MPLQSCPLTKGESAGWLRSRIIGQGGGLQRWGMASGLRVGIGRRRIVLRYGRDGEQGCERESDEDCGILNMPN